MNKNTVLIAALLGGSLAACPWIATAKSYLPSGCGTYVVCKESKNTKGELDGPQTCVNARDDKIVVIKANWRNDLLVGDFWCGNDEGEPRVKARYKDGQLDGEYQEYDSGQRDWALTQNYRAGKREGLSSRRLPDGKRLVSNYKDDKQYGYELVLNADGGILAKQRCQIDNQTRDRAVCDELPLPGFGDAMTAHAAAQKEAADKDANRVVEKKNAQGVVIERYRLVGGKVEGKSELFYKDGTPHSVVNYKAGKKVDEKRYFEGGQLQAEIGYKNDFPLTEVRYFQNGKKRSEVRAAEEGIAATRYFFKEYHDNGRLQVEGTRRAVAGSWNEDGEYDGEIRRYTESGALEDVQNYKQGNRVGKWKDIRAVYEIESVYEKDELLERTVYDRTPARKVMRRTEFMPDGSRKSDVKDPAYKEEDENRMLD